MESHGIRRAQEVEYKPCRLSQKGLQKTVALECRLNYFVCFFMILTEI